MFNLLDLEPHKISTDLSSYTTLVYGPPKTGKSTFMYKLFGQDAIFAAFEKGYLALGGVFAADIPNWTVLVTKFIAQLKDPRVQARYKVVVIDTVDLMYEAAQKFVLMREGVDKIGDIPHGAGYQMVDDLFKSALLEIIGLGYTIGFISHATTEKVKGADYEKYKPSLNKRGALIVNKMVDTIGFVHLGTDEQGQEVRNIYLRETMQFVAGTRFSQMPPMLSLDAKLFEAEMKRAIEKEEEINPYSVTSERQSGVMLVEEYDYHTLMNQLREKSQYLESIGRVDIFNAVVEQHLGKGRRVSELVMGQEDIMSILYEEICLKEKELEQVIAA